MQCSTVQYSAVQCSAVQWCAVQYLVLKCSIFVQCGAVQQGSDGTQYREDSPRGAGQEVSTADKMLHSDTCNPK